MAGKCKTAQDFKAFEDVTQIFYNYFDKIERITEKAQNKDFTSLEKFYKNFEELKGGAKVKEGLQTRKKYYFIDFIEKDIKTKTNEYFYLSYSDKNIIIDNNILIYNNNELKANYKFDLNKKIFNFE